jgi:Flp pilus assembly protein TadG
VSKTAVRRAPIWVRFWRDRQGAVALAVAVLLPVLIGFAGLGVEVGFWFWIQRQNQSAADAAAISAALEYAAQIESGLTTNPTAAATTAANYNLFSTSPPNTLTLYPCYGFSGSTSCNTSSSNGTLGAVQVVLTQPLNTAFADFVTAIWGPNLDTVNVTTTAIAAFPVAGRVCYLALDTSAANAFFVDSGGALPNSNCWAASNSNLGSALNCDGCTIAGPTNVVGGNMVSNGGQLKGTPNRTYASAIADPYATLSFTPPGTGCATIPAGATSIGPDHYCSINVTTIVNMTPGVYYIDSMFNIQSGATLKTSGGVTIIINGSYCLGDDPTCRAGHGIGGSLNVTAQTTGPFAGIAMFGPRNSNPAVVQEFANGSYVSIQGAIYFPSQTIQFDPNSQLDPSACTQIIAKQIHIENNAGVSAKCGGNGVASIPILEVYLSL